MAIFAEILRRRWEQSPAPVESVDYQAIHKEAKSFFKELRRRMTVRTDLGDPGNFIPPTEFILDLNWNNHEYHMTFAGAGDTFIFSIFELYNVDRPIVKVIFKPTDPWRKTISLEAEKYLSSCDLLRT